MLRFINSYLDVLTSTNHVVSLCSQLCSSGNTAVGKNKRILLQYLSDHGDIPANNLMLQQRFHNI